MHSSAKKLEEDEETKTNKRTKSLVSQSLVRFSQEQNKIDADLQVSYSFFQQNQFARN